MEYLAELFALVFFALIFIYLYWGIYIIKLNPKESVNRVFFAICISMSVWSLGFAMANDAMSYENALFWRRISAIAWSSLFALMLHFLLLLTHEKSSKTTKRLFRLLYIPALINLYVFSISNNLTKMQYNLQKFTTGWINISINNGWDWFFYTYYSSYLIIGLITVWHWKKQLANKKLAKQGNYIIFAFLVAFVLGSVLDVGASSIIGKPLPQMTPIYILLPTWAMYYAARYYGVMERKIFHKNEIIVTDEDQKNIFKNLGYAFCAGGVLAFISECAPSVNDGSGELKAWILKSGSLILLGVIIYITQSISQKSLKDRLTIIILVLSIPIVIFQFLDDGGLTVWVFPSLIIMTSLLFSKKTLLISSTLMAIFTQRLIWILKPEAIVQINQYDYIARIGMFILAFLVGIYINKLYVLKIKENNEQIEFQRINAEISLEFVNISQENADEKINKLLAVIIDFFQGDRAYLFLINHENKTMTYSYEYCKEGIEAQVGKIYKMPLNVFPWWVEQLDKKKNVHIPDINLMPKEAKSEKNQLLEQKVKSLISVAVEGEEGILGFIGLDSVVEFRLWSEENIKQLNILSNLISHGLIKIRDAKKIEFMAYYDRLTLLPNRFLFKDRINQALNLAKRNGTYVGVMFIDLDNFKSVNDTIGHKGGDSLIREVAQKLKNSIRATDTVARFGGDEFMIILNDIKEFSDINIIADKVMDLFRKSFNIQEQYFLITASAGVSIYPVDGEDGDTLIKSADTAMYKAKNKGKNQYVLCTTEMKDEIEMNTRLLNDLYRALENDEFCLYYQPQLDMVSGKITGLEALIRWNHPEKGMILPGLFIPLAEKNGLITLIGEWVLKTACEQNKKWQDMGLVKLRMAVNLSAIQLINPKIAEEVSTILEKTGLDPKYLELEITESTVIKEMTYIEEALSKLKKIGVTIAIDDFGTEYSSLTRLKVLPIDRIKIDMQFTQGIETNEKDRAITTVIINLAKSLNLNVLAEGVETMVQRDFLNQKSCDDVQGYYYHKPMPSDEIEKLLKMQ